MRAWVRSFGVRATISNCSNNYGPWQHIEKFIPRQITNLLDGGVPRSTATASTCATGSTPTTTARPCWRILEQGRIGETYLIGADGERNNLEVVTALLRLLGRGARRLRPRHRPRRATTCATPSTPASCAPSSAGRPRFADFEAGLADTVDWYRAHEAWWRPHKQATEAAYAAKGQ